MRAEWMDVRVLCAERERERAWQGGVDGASGMAFGRCARSQVHAVVGRGCGWWQWQVEQGRQAGRQAGWIGRAAWADGGWPGGLRSSAWRRSDNGVVA